MRTLFSRNPNDGNDPHTALIDKWLHQKKNKKGALDGRTTNGILTRMNSEVQDIISEQNDSEVIGRCLFEQEKTFNNSSFHQYYTDYIPKKKNKIEKKALPKARKEMESSLFWRAQRAFCRTENWRVPNVSKDIENHEALSWLMIDPSKIPDRLYWAIKGKISDAPASLVQKAEIVQELKTFLKSGKPFLWERLVGNKTSRTDSSKYRMLWWNNNPQKGHETLENTSCQILVLEDDNAKFFHDAYGATRQIEHTLEGIEQSLEDMEIFRAKLKTARLQILALENPALKKLQISIRDRVLSMLDMNKPVLEALINGTITRESYQNWKKKHGIIIRQDEEILSDIARFESDKESNENLKKRCVKNILESFGSTEGLKTQDGKTMNTSIGKILNLKDIIGRWNPGAFLASVTKAESKVEHRIKELLGQKSAMGEHETIMDHYLSLHEKHFEKEFGKSGIPQSLPLEESK